MSGCHTAACAQMTVGILNVRCASCEPETGSRRDSMNACADVVLEVRRVSMPVGEVPVGAIDARRKSHKVEQRGFICFQARCFMNAMCADLSSDFGHFAHGHRRSPRMDIADMDDRCGVRGTAEIVQLRALVRP